MKSSISQKKKKKKERKEKKTEKKRSQLKISPVDWIKLKTEY
jgi:hypothetical protein